MKILLTHAQIMNLGKALRSLDGRQVEVKTGDGTTSLVTKPYELSGKTRLAIAKTLARTTQVGAVVTESCRALFNEISGGAPTILPKTPEAHRLDLEMAALMAGTEEIEVNPLSTEDLKLDTNPIPPSVLEHLLVMVDLLGPV